MAPDRPTLGRDATLAVGALAAWDSRPLPQGPCAPDTGVCNAPPHGPAAGPPAPPPPTPRRAEPCRPVAAALSGDTWQERRGVTADSAPVPSPGSVLSVLFVWDLEQVENG